MLIIIKVINLIRKCFKIKKQSLIRQHFKHLQPLCVLVVAAVKAQMKSVQVQGEARQQIIVSLFF